MATPAKVVVWGDDNAPIAEAFIAPPPSDAQRHRWHCTEHGTVMGFPSLAAAMSDLARHIDQEHRS